MHPRVHPFQLLGTVALATAFIVLPAGATGAGVATITAEAEPAEVGYGSSLGVAGSLSEGGAPLSGVQLNLEAEPYASRSYATIASTRSEVGGQFRFSGVRLGENARLRVLAQTPAAASPVMQILVDPVASLTARSLGPGRDRLSVHITHDPALHSPAVPAWWYIAPHGSSRYRLAAVTATSAATAGVLYASATIDPPSRLFSYRVCLNPPWEDAMGPPQAHGPCPRHDVTLLPSAEAMEYGGEARGLPLAPFPSPAAIAAAERFLSERAGRTSLAVVDSSGELRGRDEGEHFQTASVVKVMMLVAYLQRLSGADRSLSPHDEALLYPMIHESNNEDASAVLGVIGSAALARVAREAGMRDYAPGVGWWAYTQTSAADQARFFAELERLTPPRFYAYERGLMAGIEPEQSWGVPPVARPAWQVFFKTGALPSEGLFNEVARLERGGIMFTVAVFTEGDPSMAYGEQTIEGVAARLLATP